MSIEVLAFVVTPLMGLAVVVGVMWLTGRADRRSAD
jgi:hypothetical protein